MKKKQTQTRQTTTPTYDQPHRIVITHSNRFVNFTWAHWWWLYMNLNQWSTRLLICVEQNVLISSSNLTPKSWQASIDNTEPFSFLWLINCQPTNRSIQLTLNENLSNQKYIEKDYGLILNVSTLLVWLIVQMRCTFIYYYNEYIYLGKINEDKRCHW